MHTQAAIFDLDGTLVDSLADIGESMNEVLSGMSLPPHGLDEYRQFVGDGITMLARRALPDPTDEQVVTAAVARLREIYGGRFTRKTRPYDGIPRLLEELRAKHVTLAVLSNKLHDMTTALVAELFGQETFAVVLGDRSGVPRKPAPDGAVEIAGRLGIEPARALYVGDTPIDMKTACAAGMKGVGAAWGFRPEAELVAAGAAAIARRPLDVLDYLE